VKCLLGTTIQETKGAAEVRLHIVQWQLAVA
jgi:hypothetical protein